MRYFSHSLTAACVAVAALATASCADLTRALNTDCNDVGFPAIFAQVRRSDGRGIAPGATLTVSDGAFTEASRGGGDPVGLGAANNRVGTYTVEVSKPYYSSFKRDGVNVPGNASCGAYKTVIVPVVLSALPGAPAIRSISVNPQDLGGFTVGQQYRFYVYVDAAAGIDTNVVWSVSDPRVATVDASGLVVARCATGPQDALLVATSRGDPSASASARLTISGAACP